MQRQWVDGNSSDSLNDKLSEREQVTKLQWNKCNFIETSFYLWCARNWASRRNARPNQLIKSNDGMAFSWVCWMFESQPFHRHRAHHFLSGAFQHARKRRIFRLCELIHEILSWVFFIISAYNHIIALNQAKKWDTFLCVFTQMKKRLEGEFAECGIQSHQFRYRTI